VNHGPEVDAADRHAWERPGAFEEIPGVYRIPLPLPGDHLKAVNVYAIRDGEQLVLVDGGWALTESRELLAKSLDSIGFGPEHIREFLVTHSHRDHYTQAVAIRREFGVAAVWLGEGERRGLELMRTIDAHPDIAAMDRAGAAELAEALRGFQGKHELTDWEMPDHWLTDRLALPLNSRTLEAISTPGHTSGHMIFHDAAAGAIFTGDHVLPHITPSIGLELTRPTSPLRVYMQSLALMKQLPDSVMLPAHGPAGSSTHARVDELLAHHEARLTDIAAAIEAGDSTGFEVANRIGWTRRGRRFTELDFFNQLMAVHETMAHLQVLVERGWLRGQEDPDGVTRFSRG
jgi:glyoxylase-like metal-dependent hydrolase (beta-lactamase superfamily II)